MTRPEPPAITVHRDPDLFRQAVAYTARATGFAAGLIEKDYFCTVLLAYLARADAGLVFKGGTALAKVHAGFYRLSEDLDFTIPMPADASRRQRSQAAGPLAPDLTLPCIGFNEALAEKLRAALTRREVAIRDFYDLHHAAQHLGLTADDTNLLDLLRRKLAMPGNPPIDLGPGRIDQLHRQRNARLRPVLRPQDFDSFDLDHAVHIAAQVADKLR